MTIHVIGKAVEMLMTSALCTVTAEGGENGIQPLAIIALGVAVVGFIVVVAAFLAKRGFSTGMENKSRKREEYSQRRLHSISGILRDFVMVPHLEAESADDAIVKLVHILHKSGKIENVEAVLESIRMREKSMPTGLDNGLAIPHGRTSAVRKLVGAIATVDNPNGIPNYETIDKSPVRIVILSVSSESEAVAHLHLLSDISRSLGDGESRQKLLACGTADEMSAFIAGE